MSKPNRTERLAVQCEPCYSRMGVVWEDADGGLWLDTKDRLQGFDGGEWWTNIETEPIEDMQTWNYSGCRRGRPGCGKAYSWQLADAMAELAKARHTGQVVNFRL